MTSDSIYPATAGTLLLRFKFFPSIKAHASAVKEKMIRRPVLFWRLIEDRPFPLAAGLPIDDDPESPGCSAVIIPGSGLILDCLTGQGWGSDELYTNFVVTAWAAHLKEHAPPLAPPIPAKAGDVILGGRPGGFLSEEVASLVG
jgi:hypothetical protein